MPEVNAVPASDFDRHQLDVAQIQRHRKNGPCEKNLEPEYPATVTKLAPPKSDVKYGTLSWARTRTVETR